jgi:hypothetical protein
MGVLKALSAGLGLSLMLATGAHAQDDMMNFSDLTSSSKLLATGGVSSLTGPGGGGIVPWALITGYGTDREIGGSVYGSFADTGHLSVTDGGIGIGLFNRVELTYSHLSLNLGNNYASVVTQTLNHGSNSLNVNNEGIKVRLFGDAVYDQYIPQVSAGAVFSQSQNKTLVEYIGSRPDGITYYVAATKLLFDAFLGRDVLLDADLIETKANQLGLLGFGAHGQNGYHPEFGGSAAVLLNRGLAVGVEYRTQPMEQKAVGQQNNYADIFVAWFPAKHLSITAAYAYLGDVAPAVDSPPGSTKNQGGFYISGQLAF